MKWVVKSGIWFSLLILMCRIASGQHIISGKVLEQDTGEPLSFATIILEGTTSGTITNVDGFFTLLDVPDTLLKLVISYLGYETLIYEVTPDDIQSHSLIHIKLNLLASTLEEVVVKAESYKYINTTSGVSVVTVSPRQLSMLPAIGEADIFRSLQLLPGVSGTNESSSGLFIRGGTPDQNLVLLDGMTVYKVDHFYGFFSAFNPNAIKDVQLYKGAFPARYGGRLSGVVDMTGKTGSFENATGSINLNLISAGGYLEIPLFNKFSFLFAGRRSFTDILQSGLYNKITDNFAGDSDIPGVDDETNITEVEPVFYFYDLNSKLSYRPGEKDLITFSIYNGKDFLDKSRDLDRNLPGNILIYANIAEKADWGNNGVSARWSRQWRPRLFTSMLVARSEYFSKYERDGFLKVSITDKDSVIFSGSRHTFEDNSVKDLTFRADAEWQFLPGHKLDFGLSLNQTEIDYINTRDDSVTILARSQKAGYNSFYVLENWTQSRFKVSGGIRLSDYKYSDRLLVAPRISVIYNLTDSLKLKAAYGRHYQFVNRIINENISEGSRDFWLLADGDQIDVSNASHYIAGISYEHGQWLFDVEAYYKDMQGLSEFSLRFRRGIEINADELFFTGSGIARGIEFLVQKKQGMYTGWLSYTLGSIMHTFEAFNYGKEFPALHDQKHEFKWINSFELNEWTFAATFIYGSGKPYSEPEGQYSIELLDGRKFNYIGIGAKNGSRLPSYQRLDLSAHLKVELGKAIGDIGVSIFNFLNHKNIWYYAYDFSQDPVLITEVTYLGLTPNVSFQVTF